jgi:hypothetical protein
MKLEGWFKVIVFSIFHPALFSIVEHNVEGSQFTKKIVEKLCMHEFVDEQNC